MEKLNRKERTNRKEKSETKTCKEWLVMKSCSECLFETLCGYKERCKRLQQQEK
jgi:hypothetical protein